MKSRAERDGLRFVQVSPHYYSHRKTVLLRRRLNDDRWAPDRVVRVWAYFGRYHIDGTAPDTDDIVSEIEAEAQWEGPPGGLVQAMVDVRLLDRVTGHDGQKVIAVHDWADWAGSYAEKLRKDADRKRLERATKRADPQHTARPRTSKDIHGTSGGSPAQEEEGDVDGEVEPEGERDTHREADAGRVSPSPLAKAKKRIEEVFKEIRKGEYRWVEKDTSALRKLVAEGHSVSDIALRWRRGLSAKDGIWKACNCVWQLPLKWNDLSTSGDAHDDIHERLAEEERARTRIPTLAELRARNSESFPTPPVEAPNVSHTLQEVVRRFTNPTPWPEEGSPTATPDDEPAS